MSLVSLLNIGTIGANVAQQGVSIASQNLANVNTDGYSRKQANLRPELGSSKDTSRRVVEPFVERRLLTAQSASGEASAEALGLASLDHVFADGDGSLGTALDKFQASMQDFAARPNDMAVREQVLANASHVSSAFQNTAAGLDQARADSNQRIQGSISEVNARLHQISALNGQIGKVEVGGAEASDLRDKRDQLVREVAERVPVTTHEQPGGGFSMALGGSLNLVSIDGKVNELQMVDGSADARVTMTAAGAQQDVTSLLKGGAIGGQLKARDGALKELSNKLDQLAFDFASQYNTVHQSGEGLDGVAGRDLFAQPTQVAGAARTLTVSAAVANDPQALAAGTAGSGLKTDNRVAFALSELSGSRFTTGGMTVTDNLASMTARAGAAIQQANNAQTFASGALEQVNNLRDNMSGVSTDEEMVSLMKYQQAYSASLQVIRVADEMMGELMNLRR